MKISDRSSVSVADEQRAADMAEVEAVKGSILPTAAPLGVTGTQPPVVMWAGQPWPGHDHIENFYGVLDYRLRGYALYAGLWNNRFMPGSKLYLDGADPIGMTVVEIHENLIPWDLELRGLGKNDLYIDASHSKLTYCPVFEFVTEGRVPCTLELDFSDNYYFPVDDIIAALYEFSTDPQSLGGGFNSLILDLSNHSDGTNYPPNADSQSALEYLFTDYGFALTISVAYPETLEVTAAVGDVPAGWIGTYGDRQLTWSGAPYWKHTIENVWIRPFEVLSAISALCISDVDPLVGDAGADRFVLADSHGFKWNGDYAGQGSYSGMILRIL